MLGRVSAWGLAGKVGSSSRRPRGLYIQWPDFRCLADTGSVVTFTPLNAGEVPRTIEAGGHGVVLRAGLGVERFFPDCGCQACVDDVLELIEDLEEETLGVVSAGLVERFHGSWLGYEVPGEGHFYSSGGGQTIDRARRKAIKPEFTRGQRHWQPWTPKPAESP